jgi:hypothetical protein
MGCDKELLREYYYRDAKDGRITEHEIKKAVHHAGGGVCLFFFTLFLVFFCLHRISYYSITLLVLI